MNRSSFVASVLIFVPFGVVIVNLYIFISSLFFFTVHVSLSLPKVSFIFPFLIRLFLQFPYFLFLNVLILSSTFLLLSYYNRSSSIACVLIS